MRRAIVLLSLGALVGCTSQVPATPTMEDTATVVAPLDTETLELISTSASTYSPAATSTPIVQLYQVQPGDTCFGIAESFGVSVESIVGLNGLETTCLVTVGMELIIMQPTPVLPPIITPTFVEGVHLTGQLQLSNKHGFPYPELAYLDLDTGVVGNNLGRDLVFGYDSSSAGYYVLRGLGPAALSFFGREVPEFNDCFEHQSKLSIENQTEIEIDNSFCALTSEGRLASFSVAEISQLEGWNYLTLDFTVWKSIVEVIATPIPEVPGCLKPPDDYTRVEVNGQTLNQRTLSILQHAAELYTGPIDVANLAITQGSYTDAVGLSFGTHAGGGAVDISVVARERFEILWDEIPPLLQALRTAGFAAWLREAGELSPTSVVHIHAIAIGDAEASADAEAQLTGEYGYFRGYNGLPPDFGGPALDKYGEPVLCNWMRELGYADLRD